MNYIIGDLHANIIELQKLLQVVDPQKNDTLIFLGDYLDKNTATEETLKLLVSLTHTCSCVLIKGDHEFVWDKYVNGREFFRQDFLLRYGSVQALEQYSENPRQLIEDNDINAIQKHLKPFFDLIPIMVDYYLVDGYIAVHAGINKDQLSQDPLVFEEANYFLRKDSLDMSKKYLDTYTVVAAHTHFGTVPLVRKGYINIDLGAGYGKYLGALCVEENVVIRSDGKHYPLTTIA